MNLAQVLEWKYGAVAGCDLDKGIITSWRHPTIPQPNVAQIALDMAEYKIFSDKEQFNTNIKAQIAALDQKRIRPLAEGDTVYLAKLNEQIVALRTKLK